MVQLVLGGYLVTDTGAFQRNSGIAFENGIVLKTGSNGSLLEEFPESNVAEYPDQIISPGFVNAHMHFYGVLSHGISVPPGITDFKSFLEDFWWPLVENRIDRRMIAATARAMALELINSGVTVVCDVLEAPMAVPGALSAAAEALSETGIKAVLSIEASERISRENGIACLEENISLYREYRDHPRISGLNCIHTTFTCSDDFIREAVRMSRESGAGIQMHLSESRYEPDMCRASRGLLPAEVYEACGFFEQHVVAAQCVKIEEKEFEILKKYNANAVHVPLSNCEVGGGIAPVPDMLERGINVALGTDGYINNFFEVMRGAFLLHKASKESPEVMPAETVFAMATGNGMKALKLSGKSCLEPGAPADFITIKPVLPTPLTEDNIYSQIILYCNPENVMNVFSDGQILKKDGKLLAGDLAEEYKILNGLADRLWEGGK